MEETIYSGIRRILAPNPSPMTFTGTNTYLIGHKEIAVIDPGPKSSSHLNNILKATKAGSKITKIFVTHSHLDHSPLAAELSEQTNAKIYAFGDSFAGRSTEMNKLAHNNSIGGGEGVDTNFKPNVSLMDGAELIHDNEKIIAIWTPGHFGNHMSFIFKNFLFCGDHVMGWASSMVSPPDGDLAAFRKSCAKLLEKSQSIYLPGHGQKIEDGPSRIRWLLSHRDKRELQILNALTKKPDTAEGIAKRIYTDVDPQLLPAATRNVIAHLFDLVSRKRIAALGPLKLHTKYSVL
jgi:glyoxylase-like metal-dependent hydrolase (beta-lactamase superfamily II)